MNDIKNIEPSQPTKPGMGYTHCCASVPSVVYNEDCIEGLKRFSDNFFDVAIVDPPYGIDVANMNMGAGKGKRCSKMKNRSAGKNLIAATSGKKSGGLFLFSFFEPKCLLKAIHRLAANVFGLGEVAEPEAK